MFSICMDEYPEPDLYCIYCKAKASLEGRWHNARVSCMECGQEMTVSAYEDQLENWKENACVYAADSTSTNKDG